MKQTVYEVHWTRQKGKIKKTGSTIVAAFNISTALGLFEERYPDRIVEQIWKMGDDLLVVGQPLL